MEKVDYYWIENKKDLKIIEQILKEHDIFYEVKKGMINEVHQVLKCVYIIKIIDKQKIQFADEILSQQTEYHLVSLDSKRIVPVNKKIKKKNNTKERVTSITIIIIYVLFLLSPIALLKSKILINILLAAKIALSLALLFIAVKKDIIALPHLMIFEGLVISLFSRIYFGNHALYSVAYTSPLINRCCFFILILVMVATLLYIVFYGLINYKRSTLKDKFKYCVSIMIGYLIIMSTTIIGYASLFSGYHNELYYKFEEKLDKGPCTINEYSTECVKEIEDENGSLKIEGYYHKKQGGDLEDFHPYRISIEKYDNNNKEKLIYSVNIEPVVNRILEEETMGNTFYGEYLYFSAVTYFTIGYGDVYPIANIAKSWVLQEALIAHILSLIIVPSLIVAGQIFASKEEK